MGLRSKRIMGVAIAAAVSGIFGFAPAVMAWANPGIVREDSHCWRTIGTDNGEWGGNGDHYFTAAGIKSNYKNRLEVALRKNGDQIDWMSKNGRGFIEVERDRDGVTGGRTYTVFLVHRDDYVSSGGNPRTDSCAIT